MCPLIGFLRKLVDLLRSRDTGEIFIEPVDLVEVPDYGDIVKKPMDLSTMRHKVDSFQYNSLKEFEDDFNLMINNCLAYNSKDTVFYRAALKMREQVKIFNIFLLLYLGCCVFFYIIYLIKFSHVSIKMILYFL